MGNGATGRSEPLTPLAEDREEWWSADQRGSAPRDRRPPRSRPGSERRGRASTMAPPPEPPRSAPRARRRLRYDDASDGEASPDEERRRERRAPAASPAQPPARGCATTNASNSADTSRRLYKLARLRKRDF